jgi:hypothetical protein
MDGARVRRHSTARAHLAVVPTDEKTTTADIATETDSGWIIDTGSIRAIIARSGDTLVQEIWQEKRLALKNGRLVLRTRSGDDASGTQTVDAMVGHADSVVLEQNGPQRAVLTLRGTHRKDNDAVIQFVVRLYWYAGSATVRVMHTLVYDNEQPQRAISGVGLAFDAPQQAALTIVTSVLFLTRAASSTRWYAG